MATRFEVVHGMGRAERVPVRIPLDSGTANVKVGHAITSDGATSGYYQVVDGSGESLVGIAMEEIDSPSADGGASVLVDVSENTYYRADPDAGTVTTALRFTTADIGADGGSVNIDASATDNVKIHDVDTDRNEVIVSFTMATYTGVA